ncbi:hypothetical protein MLD38_008137 [Melastoma candidum]|uniref:Uncharacterized protein n=1 Tax=Melastoma candidum TaxID=119954 RepID=A0ACB9RSZ0_9MYRT|nr:hypothetical protein MLD38_008137 [Melastoma candidum]
MEGPDFGGGFLSVSCGGSLDLEQPPMTDPRMSLLIGRDDDRHPPIRFVEVGNLATRGAAGGKGGDDDEASSEDGNCENPGKGKKGLSPWHRMKWTDDVVRLLIAAVAYVGDDGVLEDSEVGLKRKFGVFQKKGKWKTVSKIMIGRGCRVSPQQCEDKFNDLNKRYKKLNDILGRGTSRQVVENPALLDSVPQLSAKARDVVRKLLSSKHLFYKEMCAYHDGQSIPNCPDLDLHLEGGCKDEDDDNDTNSEDEDSSDYRNEDDSNEDNDCGHNKRSNFGFEIGGPIRYQLKQSRDLKELIRKQLLELEEESVNIEARTLELEKQRFRWLRYRSKKSREMERLRLENERKGLENERSLLELKQKELEINPRISSKPHGMDHSHGRDQIDLSRQ